LHRLAIAIAIALSPLAAAGAMAAAPVPATPASSPASSPAPAASAVAPTGWTVNLRYRYEGVDDEAFARNADAHTARIRAGYSFVFDGGWSALLEGEGVAELNSRFNSGANGETGYPLVGDARALEINQAWVDWRGAALGTRIGRQMIVLDNGRFFANGVWRHNMQTFDAVQAQWRPAAAWDVQAYYLDAVQRSAGNNARNRLARERDLDGRLLRVARTVPGGNVAAYGFWVEDEDVRSASTRTLGLRWASAWALDATWRMGLTLEAATQQPWADAAGGRTGYALVEPRLERGPLVFRAGFERLGAGDGRAFQTAFGSLHAFNGWADQFTTTPINGLEDRYLSVQGAFTLAGKAATWQVRGHDFQSDHGADYGTEWNASLGLTMRPGLAALVKLADYESDGFARDTRKLWFQLEWAL